MTTWSQLSCWVEVTPFVVPEFRARVSRADLLMYDTDVFVFCVVAGRAGVEAAVAALFRCDYQCVGLPVEAKRCLPRAIVVSLKR